MYRLLAVMVMLVSVVPAVEGESLEAAQRDTIIIRESERDTIIIRERESDTPGDTTDAFGREGGAIGELEPEDVNELHRRRRSLRLYGFGFGPAGFGNIDMRRLAYNLYTGVFWEVNPHAMVKSFFDFTADFDRSFMGSVHLGANLIPFNAEVSPFVGGSLGLGIIRSAGTTTFGFDLGGSLGVHLFRLSTTQLQVEAIAHVLLSEVREQFPYVYAVRVGILF